MKNFDTDEDDRSDEEDKKEYKFVWILSACSLSIISVH